MNVYACKVHNFFFFASHFTVYGGGGGGHVPPGPPPLQYFQELNADIDRIYSWSEVPAVYREQFKLYVLGEALSDCTYTLTWSNLA